MTDAKEKLSFNETVERLDTIAGLKLGDPIPKFIINETNGTWGDGMASLVASAAAYIREQSKRISDLLRYNNEFEERARQAERAMKDLLRPRPIEEYHEDMGDVLWWKFPIEEPPYVGRPTDIGLTVEAHTYLVTHTNQTEEPVITRLDVGGWPGYHTHWTPLPDASKIVKP